MNTGTWKKRIISALLSLWMVASTLPVPAAAANAVTLDVSKGYIEITATGYKAAGAASETAYTGDYVITGISADAAKYVTVSGGTHTITLKDVNIDFSNGSATGDAATRSAFSIESGAAVNLVLSGDANILKSSRRGAALRVPEGASLTVSGDGTLNAYATFYGAAIGGANNESAGSITISGGTVNATVKNGDSGAFGAAIGGGSSGAAGTIRIEGGTVTAESYTSGAAIGSGDDGASSGSVTITGGTVTATSSSSGAGIGSGNKANCCAVTITGGTVTATSSGGAGIGGGNGSNGGGTGGNVTISGGTVTATSYSGAGIGGGNSTFYSGGSLTVTGGYVKATSTQNSGIGGGKGTTVVIDGGIVDATLAQNDTLKNSAGDTLNTTRTTASIIGIAGDTVPTAITYTKSDGTAVSYGCKGTTVALLGTPGIYLPAGAVLTGATAAETDYAGSIASGSGGTLAIKDPTVVWNADLVLGGSTGAETYQLGYNDKIPYAGKITLKTDGAASNSSNISIENGGYVIFDHVNHTSAAEAPSLYIESDSTMELKGDNTLSVRKGNCVLTRGTLTIKGTGSLTLNSGSACGSAGTLIIESGTLHSNQVLSANTIKIGGGNIDANFSVQPVKESDSSVPVYKTEVALYDVYGASAAVTNASLPGYDFSGIKTDENGKIYLYLPAGAVSIQFGSTTLSGTIAANNDNVLAPAVSLGLVSGEAQRGLTSFTLPVNSQSGGTVYYAVSDAPLTSAAAVVSAAGENHFVSDGSKRTLTFSGLNPGTEYTVQAVENMPGHYYSGIASAAVTTLPLGLLYNGAEKADWYTGDVTLTASGYTICDSESGTYTDSYTVSETCVNKTLYFQKNGEKFSAPVSVNIDKTAPTGRVTVGTHWWDKLLETITFGYYNANRIQISAADEQSGIAKISFTATGSGCYTAAELKELPEEMWSAYDDADRPYAAEGSKMVVYARITNRAGLVTYLSSDGLIADMTVPTITVSAKEILDVSATLSIKASEDADIYYYCTDDASEGVDAQKLLAQTKNTVKGDTAADFLLSDLAPSKAYKFYSMAVDRATNASVINQYSFSTTKTVPTVTVKPTASSIVYGGSLSQSTLAGGSASVPGRFAWSDSSYAPDQVKDGKAVLPENACVFIPTDTDHYAQLNVGVTVGVNQRPITIETASVSDKTYDGTNAASVSSVTFANTAFGQTLVQGVDYEVAAHYDSTGAGNSVPAAVAIHLVNNDKTKNYSLTNNNITISGKIVPKSVQYSIPGEQTVRIGSGLDLLQAPEKGTGLGQDTISGALRWHLGSASAPALDNSFVFSGKDGDKVALYWDFTPDGSMTNYSTEPITGVVTVTLAQKAPTKIDIVNDGSSITYGTTWEGRASLSKVTPDTSLLDGTVKVALTRADGTSTSVGVYSVKDGSAAVALSLKPAQLPAGEYDVTFTYSGNIDYTGATSSTHVKVNPVRLGYDLSGLHAVKNFDGTTKADVAGTVGVTGVLTGENAGFSYTSVTGEYMTASIGKQKIILHVDGIKVSNPNYVFIGDDFPEIEGEILGTELPIEDPTTVPSGEKAVLQEKIRVPDSLSGNPKLNTPEKIEQQMKLALRDAMGQIKEENIRVYDVDCYCMDSDGKTWSLATPSNLPASGLQIVIPYPEGTDAANYDFTVMHMISFGSDAGKTEKLQVTKGLTGLVATMHSFSPVVVGYTPISSSSRGSYFNVIASAGEGGTISADAMMPIVKYGSVTYTITPAKGYVIADVLVDGVSVGAVDSYTFSRLISDHTISASFKLANTVQNPNTGDNSGVGIAIAATGILLSAAAGTVIYRRKREH